MRTALEILEAEVDTLVFHMEDRSTDFLKPIYEGRGYPVITGSISLEEARRLIKAHRRVFMLGHGGPSGLFMRGFFAGDREIGDLLAEKEDGLYIWCNADAFAHRNKLTGLVSGMFISEVGEARIFGIQATQQEVDASNNLFSKVVRQVMDAGGAYTDIQKCYNSASCKITKFNNERLYIFDHGNPSPALHPTSLAHPPARSAPERDTFEPPQGEQSEEELAAQREVAEQTAYWVAAMLDKQAAPEEAAEGIARHMPGGEEAYDTILAACAQALEMDVSYDEGVEMVLDAIFGPF
jgi:hypothetical protein